VYNVDSGAALDYVPVQLPGLLLVIVLHLKAIHSKHLYPLHSCLCILWRHALYHRRKYVSLEKQTFIELITPYIYHSHKFLKANLSACRII
jgi:hypothetical protein